MADKQHFQYFAFISYSRKDEAWAKWLQNALESYRLPAAIRKDRLDVPARIRPVFRDKTDLAGGFLEEQLHKELEASRHLIILCSPNSARSEWVNKEAAHFISMGRESDIIPFIVSGVPHSGDDRECFPRALREMEKEPLGIDVQDLGKTPAFLKVVSTLLDVRHDQIVMRHRRRTLRNRLIAGTAGLLAAAGLGFGIWWNTPHTAHYHNYITRFEIPQGIGEMSRSEIAHSYDSYRITTLRGKVVRLERVNSAGTVVEPLLASATQDASVLCYTYDDTGRLIGIDSFDFHGQRLSSKGLTYGADGLTIAIDYRSADNLHGQAQSADLSYRPLGDDDIDSKSEVTRLYNTYSPEGYLLTSMFQEDSLGRAACDMGGVYGKAYEYDALGRVIRVRNLDVQGNVYNCRYGWAVIEYTYDTFGNLASETYFDADGSRALNENGISQNRFTSDGFGNYVYLAHFDTEDLPCPGADGEFAQGVSYDDRGFSLRFSHYDAQGEPMLTRDGYHEARFVNDDLGRGLEEWYYDLEGHLAYSPTAGYAGTRLELDHRWQTTRQWFFGPDGEPLYHGAFGACQQIRTAYDENGWIREYGFFDEEGQPVLGSDGFASARLVCDADGNVLSVSYFDTEGQPVRSTANAAVIRHSYDSYGNRIRTEYFDEQGSPCPSAEGYACVQWEYENGNRTRTRYFDAQGEPMTGAGYYHEMRETYDDTGNCVRRAYYDLQGNLTVSADGYAVREMEFDAYGNLTQWLWLDTELSPITGADGYFRVTDSYDSRGNLVRRELYEDPNQPQLHYTLVFEYNTRGDIVRQLRYGTDGQPENSESAAAEARITWDAAGNELRRELFGPDGEPWEGIANLYEFTYDDRGNVILAYYAHADASGAVRCLWQERKTYDSYGNLIRLEYLDGTGAPSDREEGYATVVRTYTPTGLEASVEYYDRNGAPALCDGFTWRKETDYDAVGNPAQIRWYGADGMPLRQEDGLVAVTRYEYDARGLAIRRTQFNQHGQLYSGGNNTYALTEYDYDPMGYSREMRLYDSTGALVRQTLSVTVVSQVQETGPGQEAGILANDVLLIYGGWEFLDTDTPSVFHGLTAALNGIVPPGSTAVFARYDGEGFHLYRTDLPETGLGIRLKQTNMPVDLYEALEQAWEDFRG